MFSSNSHVFHRPRHEMIMFLRMFSTVVMAWLLFPGFCNSHHEKVRRHFRTLVSLVPERSEHDPLQTVDFVWVTWRRPVCRRSQRRTWSQDDPKTGNSGRLECFDRMLCLDIVMSITSSSFHLNCPVGGWKSDWCWCGICLKCYEIWVWLLERCGKKVTLEHLHWNLGWYLECAPLCRKICVNMTNQNVCFFFFFRNFQWWKQQ